MRRMALLLLVACSHTATIGPDDAGGADALAIDAATEATADGSGPSDFSHSGSRIRVLTVNGDDGSHVIAPFLLDMQTGCFCQWNPTDPQTATQWRCAPVGNCDAGPSSTWAIGTLGSL